MGSAAWWRAVPVMTPCRGRGRGNNRQLRARHGAGDGRPDLGTANGDPPSVGHDTISNFGAVRGSAFNDTLTGGDGAVLEGGAGADELIGKSVGSDGSVTASYEHATAGVTVNLLNPGLNTGEASGDTFVFVSR